MTIKPYAVYINHGNYQTAEWRLDRRYKTMEQAEQRADLLREAYDVRIVKSNTGVGDADSCACE